MYDPPRIACFVGAGCQQLPRLSAGIVVSRRFGPWGGKFTPRLTVACMGAEFLVVKTHSWLCSWSRATLILYLRFCDSFNRGRRRIMSSRRDVLGGRTTRFPCCPIISLRKFFNITEFLPCKDGTCVSREVGKEQRSL
ncbi:hypothetical protein PoB_004352500 [Plakobranchus ocellatus]|uniref:Uncharacterized protein n=1 Tax=Plakobranchus ocellatus TaxID=259542 RepID=A0AAV4B8W2_9GAST|nr:hypothetical protein PoB_004352500 [Plakobranchus ocellatus]